MLEYVPETVYRASRHYAKLKQPMPMLQIKLYMYQLLRSLAYIHSVGICHRDIKPQNLLLNPATGVLKLCDFGSAKILVAGEPNVSYICSRYYRAPELIFGATNYTTNIGQCFGFPLFVGAHRLGRYLVDWLRNGRADDGPTPVPGRERDRPAGGNHQNPWHAFQGANQDDEPQLHGAQVPPNQASSFCQSKRFLRSEKQVAYFSSQVFRPRTAPEAIDLVSKLLEYTPAARLSAVEAMVHPFFDELRTDGARMPNGKTFPPLFNFTREGKVAGHDAVYRLLTRPQNCPSGRT